MKWTILPLLFSIVMQSGCDSPPDTKPESSWSEPDTSAIDTSKEEDSLIVPVKESPAPVDVMELKKLPFLETTSGIPSSNETVNLCRPSGEGFFGRYNLFKREKYKMWEPLGSLIVFFKGTTDKWFYENDNETFAQVTLESPQISVWDSIRVGMKEEEVLRFIDTSFHYKKGTLLYADLYGYSSEFRINADTVEQIKISKKCAARHEK